MSILIPYQDMLIVQILRIITGSIFVLFIPGYLLCEAFFHKNEIDLLERIALSFALSISIVPLLVFYSNLVGMQISALNTYAIVFHLVVLLSIYILFFQKNPSWIWQK